MLNKAVQFAKFCQLHHIVTDVSLTLFDDEVFFFKLELGMILFSIHLRVLVQDSFYLIAARLIRLSLFLYFLLLHNLNGGGAYKSPTFQASVEAGVKDLDDVWVPALG